MSWIGIVCLCKRVRESNFRVTWEKRQKIKKMVRKVFRRPTPPLMARDAFPSPPLPPPEVPSPVPSAPPAPPAYEFLGL